ncbi:hypothetical protein KKD52_08185 [Myxococcota bacterium]|nr:hypothetical protein [Myxococcota bacterium]MBU1411910.1 hypothetical protein [Myxococcota bacterium]MBU1510327.1 hypothetical protein [Myxococcota bacterium]
MSFVKNKIIALSALAIFTFGTVSCGYILYPNRRNQIARGGNMDVAVLIMDLLWLIPGIVPGVVALIWDGVHGSWYASGDRTILQNTSPKPLQMRANRDISIQGTAVGNDLAVRIEDAVGRSHVLTPTVNGRGTLTLRVPGAVSAGPCRLLISTSGQTLRPIPILVD